MALTTKTVTGTLYYPEGSVIGGAKVTFTLSTPSSSVVDPGTLPPSVITVVCGADGTFTTELWPNSLGSTQSEYVVTVSYPNKQDAKIVTDKLGKIQVPSEEDSYTLSDLLAAGVVAPNAVYLGVITEAQYNAAIQAAADAETFATQAEAFGNPSFNTIALMAAYPDAVVGQTVSVYSGNNGEREDFEATAGGLTADGALVVDGVGVQWVSKRTVFSTIAEMVADPRDYTSLPVGAVLLGGGFRYKVLPLGSATPDLTNSGGVLIEVLPFGGAYHLDAWSLAKDGVTDDYAKMRRAGDACRINNIGRLVLPSGRIYLSEEFVVDWQATIVGSGGLNWSSDEACTTLMFPSGVNGIRVPRGNTTTPNGKLGDWCRLIGFSLVCVGDNSNSTGHGVLFDARADLHDIFVKGFPEDGFRVDASTGYPTPTNANLTRFYNCRAESNGRDGFSFEGADGNAGSCIGCDAPSNGRFNFYDSSFLGNSFISCHASVPGKRAYGKGSDGKGYRCKLDHVSSGDTIPVTGANWTDYWEEWAPSTTYSSIVEGVKYYDSRAGNSGVSSIYNYVSDNANSTTTFLGCYAEGTNVGFVSNLIINDRKTISGGIGMSVDLPNTRDIGNSGPLRALLYADNNSPDNASRIESHLGSGDGRYSATSFYVREPGFSGQSWNMTWDTSNRIWRFGPPAASNRTYDLCESSNVFNLPIGMLNFATQGVAISSRVHVHMSAAPTSGTWRRGDRIYHLNPIPGGFEGWVCTTAGTAGSTAVFKTFGSIEA